MADESKPPENEPTQYALALFDSRPEILKKPVQAIHMAITGGVQNKTQRLAWNAMLKNAHNWHANNPGKNTDIYEIPRTLLMEMIDYRSPNRKHLKDTLTQMQDLKVAWDLLKQDGDSLWTSTVLLPTVAFDKDKIYYSYAPVIKPMLLDTTTFARLDLRIQRSFRLDASAALYEWCNRFRNNPSKRTNIMTWEEWRWCIYGSIEENSILKEYKIFKKNKLKPAIEEINTISDLEIELIELREGGRRIKNLQFIVRERHLFEASDETDIAKQEWEEKLKDLGLSAKDRTKVLATYKLEVIEAHYRYTMSRVSDANREKIKNVGKYFLHALEQGYANDQVKTETPQDATGDILKEVREALMTNRSKEAAGMFKEMGASEQEELIAEYNNQENEKALQIPSAASKRVTRIMAPFYSWLSRKTWGEPSAQDLIEFAIKTGKISLTGKP